MRVFAYDCGKPRHMYVDCENRRTNIVVAGDTLTVDWEDGRTISVPISWYPRLAYGTAEERADFQISGAGCGIYCPGLDEVMGVEGLLLGRRSTKCSSSFKRWL